MEAVLFSVAVRKSKSNVAILLAVRQIISASCYLLLLFLMGLTVWHTLPVLTRVFHHPWLILACVATAGTSYLAYYYFIKLVGASLATVFNATFIFWAALFSSLSGITVVSPYFWLWAMLLVLGIYFADQPQ